jgi:hypothetical protein|tara:strand:- start:86 stop:385 length:300 start_codon:yes stop_codon:yes gene_type:complete
MKKIICQWKRDGKCIVQPDGQVFRCCYLKIHFERNSFKAKEHPIMKEYLDNIEDHNVKNNTLKTILNSKWFTKTLPESISDGNYDTAPLMCQRKCTVKE